jgi:WD40 repeat protein
VEHCYSKKEATFDGVKNMVTSVEFIPGSNQLISGGGDYSVSEGELFIWNIDKKQVVVNLSKSIPSVVTSIAVSTDGKSLAVASEKNLYVWNLAEIKEK